MNKPGSLLVLQQAWANCQACSLCEKRNNVVFGYGNPDAQVMIIGEAPGEMEDRQGVPFIGHSGQLLDLYLGQVSFKEEHQIIIDRINNGKRSKEVFRDASDARRELRENLLEDNYFSNVVMCRPEDNRDPIPKEIEACRARLLEEIYLVDPVIIITAGRIAAEVLTGRKIAMTMRGELFDVEIPGRIRSIKYPVLPVLHPSFLLRSNDFKQKGGNGVKTYNDFIRAMNIIDKYNENHHSLPIPTTRPKAER